MACDLSTNLLPSLNKVDVKKDVTCDEVIDVSQKCIKSFSSPISTLDKIQHESNDKKKKSTATSTSNIQHQGPGLSYNDDERGEHSCSEDSPRIKEDSDDCCDVDQSITSLLSSIDQHASTLDNLKKAEDKKSENEKSKATIDISKKKKKKKKNKVDTSEDEENKAKIIALSENAKRLGLTHGRNTEKGAYYCKYCGQSWALHHFRNAQQFGAHCSNCSRKRKVSDPQKITSRERNSKRARKRASSMMTKRQTTTNNNKNRPRRRKRANSTKSVSPSSNKQTKQTTKKNKNNNNNNNKVGNKRKKKRVQTFRVVTPCIPLAHEHVISDPNSMGGLLEAVETSLVEEKQRNEMVEMKKELYKMREQVNMLNNENVSQLRFRFASLFQELRVDLLGKLEAVKVDLSSDVTATEKVMEQEHAHINTQMEELKGILAAGRAQRAAITSTNNISSSSSSSSLPSSLSTSTCVVGDDTSPTSCKMKSLPLLDDLVASLRTSCMSQFETTKTDLHRQLTLQEERLNMQFDSLKSHLYSEMEQWHHGQCTTTTPTTPVEVSSTSVTTTIAS